MQNAKNLSGPSGRTSTSARPPALGRAALLVVALVVAAPVAYWLALLEPSVPSPPRPWQVLHGEADYEMYALVPFAPPAGARPGLYFGLGMFYARRRGALHRRL